VVLRDRTCVPTLETYALDGRRLAVVEEGFEPEDLGFAWSPDGSMVAFTRFQDGPPEGMCGSQGGVYEPEDTIQDVILMRADGSGLRTLVSGVHGRGITWSPDGRTIALLATTAVPAEDLSEVLLVEVATGRVRQIPASVSGIDLRSIDEPAFSPDGMLLAIPAWRDGQTRIVVVDPATSVARDVGAAGDLQPMSWSHSGDSIAVARGSNEAQLWLLDPAGREAERRLGRPGYASHLYCWLAGGESIVILGEGAVVPGDQLGPGWSVFIQPASGADPRVAVPAEAGWSINDLGCAP
jgi:Tol biopolymer transport system component